MAIATKIIGLDKLKAKFQALPDEIKGEIRAAMEKGAGEMVALAKGLVPVGTGALRDSIGWTWGNAPKGSMVIATSAGVSGADRITIYAGNDTAFYARWVEFGTQVASAHPYFYPAYRALKRKARSRNNRAMSKAIKKVANGGV